MVGWFDFDVEADALARGSGPLFLGQRCPRDGEWVWPARLKCCVGGRGGW